MNIGRLFEKFFARKYGGKEVPGSGNKWFRKMDVEGYSLLWSLKATEKESFRVTKEDLNEVWEAVKGPGGVGGCIIPGMAVGFYKDGECEKVLALVDMNDLIALFEEEITLFEKSKKKDKYEKTHIPTLFRNQ